jgi:hypothetical protein
VETTEEVEMKRVMYLMAVLVAAAFMAGPMVAQTSPFAGTWKLNAAKSKYEGTAAPKSLTRTVTADGKGLKYAFEGVAADGSKLSYGFSSNFDGKDSAISGVGMPGGADTITLTKVSESKTEAVLKKGGKEIGKASSEVSKDGKSVTVKTSGKGADGKEVKSESVYDKQ